MDPRNLRKVRILVIDDDEDDWLIIKSYCSKIKDFTCHVEWASTYEQGIEKINENAHDAYLIDYRLGSKTGMEILEYAHPERRRQPFILMTGVLDSELEWRSLRLAAADYLVKGSFDEIALARTISYAMQRKFIEQQRIDQLLELNHAKDEFISIASHQLRTPATGVKQYLGMVVDGFAGEVPEQQLTMLKQAYRSNERQLRIISDLLKVAQVDSGKLKLHTQPAQINELIDEVIDEQRSTLQSRSQSITVAYPNKTFPTANFDTHAIRMVLENIVNNASKYSHEGESISVEVTDDKDAVAISVIDQGVGIDEHDLPRLFEKFSRFNNPLSTKVGGTGLGLYWAKRIVDMHGGRIDYQPNTPNGSIFSVVLPKSLPQNSELIHTS
ncbi:MAG: Hybrid sensor histidine kinase/response regulator [Patescibacteria group bacterium]|jgi:two-component system sensor histidine kinase/response regulator|nr:Hybrid sensor histidine kinase/response regulator [Patescibacteria group bacterium]